MRSLYSQQQTHGLRLADTTCLSLQHSALPTPTPTRLCLPLQSPASAEISVYKQGLPENSISSSNNPLEHAPNSVLGIPVNGVRRRQLLSWKTSCLSIFPSVFVSGFLCPLPLIHSNREGPGVKGQLDVGLGYLENTDPTGSGLRTATQTHTHPACRVV